MAPPISPEPRRLIGRGPGPPAPAAPSSAAGLSPARKAAAGGGPPTLPPFGACGRLRSEARGRGARPGAATGGAEPPHEEGLRALSALEPEGRRFVCSGSWEEAQPGQRPELAVKGCPDLGRTAGGRLLLRNRPGNRTRVRR